MAGLSPHAERREILYAGHVQGVGFRYTVHRLARGFSVTGFVRNLCDGRVELVVEGESGDIDSFLEEISDRMRQYIRSTTVRRGSATGEFGDFRIAF